MDLDFCRFPFLSRTPKRDFFIGLLVCWFVVQKCWQVRKIERPRSPACTGRGPFYAANHMVPRQNAIIMQRFGAGRSWYHENLYIKWTWISVVFRFCPER